MIQIRDWETEKVREFKSEDEARIWCMSKLIQKYISVVGEEDLNKLCNRLGFEHSEVNHGDS